MTDEQLHLHCRMDGFSPQAPRELCEALERGTIPPEVNQVSEPSALMLVLLGVVLLWYLQPRKA